MRFTAVKDATLVVRPGEFVSVVGPTGCGKSTLLNVAAGLLAPSSGSVEVFGEPLAGHQPPGRLSVPERGADALAHRADNVTVGLEFRGVAREDAVRRPTPG